MGVDEQAIIKYVDQVYYFALKRLSNRQDAEDLSSEIMAHVIDGISKYNIKSLDSWVWRIAHNRYARFIEAKRKNSMVSSTECVLHVEDDYDFINKIEIEDEYKTVFAYLHTLAAEYKNLMVDYYIEATE